MAILLSARSCCRFFFFLILITSPPAWTSSVGMLSIPANFHFFSDDLLRLWLQTVQYDFQHDFDEAGCSVVMALLQVAFFGKYDNEGLGPPCWSFSSLPYLIADCCESSDNTLFTSSAWMLSTPADFPLFNDCTAASTSLRRMGWSSSVSVWGQFSTDGSPLAL